MALLYALIMARLLGGLTPALEQSRRYWVHTAWIFTLVLVAVLQWWTFWGMKDVAWTPIRFIWALSNPAVLFVVVAVLVGEDPSLVASFREYFFAQRVRFFSLQLVAGTGVAMAPWIFGLTPWFAFAPAHPVAASIAALSLAGLAFQGHTAHATIVSLMLLLTGASILLIPVEATSA